MKLTEALIRKLPAGRYTDSEVRGLTLFVRPSGGRSWVQRIVVNGKRLDRGLGGSPDVPLGVARALAQRNRTSIVLSGRTVDPFKARQRQGRTFADAEAETFKAKHGGWKESSRKSWQSTMKNHVLPRLGSVRLSSLTRDDVIKCLESIDSLSEARKARQRVSAVVEIAFARGWVTENVANGGVDAALPKLKGRSGGHHKAAPYADVADILRALPPSVAGDCLSFAVLTGARSNEARGAQWSEFDIDAATWIIPGVRMKQGKDHRVPLSDAALAILRKRQGLHKRFVFASERTGRALSPEALARLARPNTVHGFRSSFRDWATDTGQDRDLARIMHQGPDPGRDTRASVW